MASYRLFIKICVALFTAGTEGDQNGLDHPSVEVSLDENSGMLVDGFERTFDGKLKCRYCNYASKGTARLIEHIRIHTGMGSSLCLPGRPWGFTLRWDFHVSSWQIDHAHQSHDRDLEMELAFEIGRVR